MTIRIRGFLIGAVDTEVDVTRTSLLLAVILAASAVSGCASVTDFGIKAGPGFDVNPFNLRTDEPVFSAANDQYYSNGDPMDCRTHH